MNRAARYTLEESFARARAAEARQVGDASRAEWWTLQADTASSAASAERYTRGAGRAAIRRAAIPGRPPQTADLRLPEPAPEPEPTPEPVPVLSKAQAAAYAFAETGHPHMEQCLAILAESLPELSEAELIADLAAAEDAGRPDTAALIEEELRRRTLA